MTVKRFVTIGLTATLGLSMLGTLPVSAEFTSDNICMVTNAEIDELKNSIPNYEGKDVSLAVKFKAGYDSNIYKVIHADYLYNYYVEETKSLSPDNARDIIYYTETDGVWCAYRKNNQLLGDSIIRIAGHVLPGYLTMMQYKEKTLEIMEQTDEEIIDLKYYDDHIFNISCIYFKTNSGEYVIPYHNTRYVEVKSAVENGKMYPAEEYAEMLYELRASTDSMTIDNSMVDKTSTETIIPNPDGIDSIISGDINYDSMEITGTGVILGDANSDGKLNVRDSSFIANTLAGKSKTTLPDNADYNKDGKKDIRDAADISRNLSKK